MGVARLVVTTCYCINRCRHFGFVIRNLENVNVFFVALQIALLLSRDIDIRKCTGEFKVNVKQCGRWPRKVTVLYVRVSPESHSIIQISTFLVASCAGRRPGNRDGVFIWKKFLALLPRSRLEKPRYRQPSHPILSFEHSEIFTKD